MPNVSHFQISSQVIDIKDPVARQVTDMTSGRLPANWSQSQGNYILIGDSYLAGEGELQTGESTCGRFLMFLRQDGHSLQAEVQVLRLAGIRS